MPKRCIAAGCSTSSEEGYTLNKFPRDESIRAIGIGQLLILCLVQSILKQFAMLSKVHVTEM